MAQGPRNLIAELTGYAICQGRNPREDRLTISIAAVLARSDVLAKAFARTCAGELPPGAVVEVRTHAPAGTSGGFIDLQLRIADRLSQTLIWAEAKLESHLSGDDQLDKYAKALPARGCLVLVAPARRRAEFARQVECAGASFLAWEQVYDLLRGERHQVEASAGWLLEEVLSYMEDQNLSRPEMLTIDDVAALKRMSTAWAGLDAMFGHAATLIASDWKSEPARSTPDEWYEEYRPRQSGWHARTRFGWQIELHPEVGCWAGMLFESSQGPFERPGNEDTWLSKLVAARADTEHWQRDPESRTTEWITSWLPLDRVLEGAPESIEAQAEVLSTFVLKVFADLEAVRL